MLQNGNIDLVHENKELEAFLSVCLEKADLVLGPVELKPEEKDVMPASRPEMAGPGEARQGYQEPAAGETAVRVAEPYRVEEHPEAESRVPVPEREPEPRQSREKSIYETFAERPADEAQTGTAPDAAPAPSEPVVELPKSHFSPDEKLSVPPVQLSALERELAQEKQQLDREGTAPAADAGDRSSLRKPTKNLAAMEFARKQAEQQKRMRTLLAVLAAAVLILGIAWFVPFQKIADSLLGPEKGPSVQVDGKAAGARDAAAKKTSRD